MRCLRDAKESYYYCFKVCQNKDRCPLFEDSSIIDLIRAIPDGYIIACVCYLCPEARIVNVFKKVNGELKFTEKFELDENAVLSSDETPRELIKKELSARYGIEVDRIAVYYHE